MLTLRPARWPDDLAALAGLDSSFTTVEVYRVIRGGRSFQLAQRRIDPPLRKDYGPIAHHPGLQELDCAVVAEQDGRVAGFAGAEYSVWNRRMVVRHLYVAPEFRRAGIGRELLRRLEDAARSAGARCLWLETQNVNVPAVQFYERAGFRLCGLDDSLYDQAESGGEIALFFMRDLPGAAEPDADVQAKTQRARRGSSSPTSGP